MVTQRIRCRAANPERCWKHGTGIGFDEHRLIRDVMRKPQINHSKHEIFSQPLKTYEGYQMASVVTAFSHNTSEVNARRVKEALLLASDMHKVDTRANRAQHDRTPYIEHPLRNTIRIIRWGCKDEATIIGSLLHDVVEDHPFEIAREYAKKEPADEAEAREISLQYIEQKFGKQAAETVRGMSNPISEDRYMPAEQKNIIYAEHVKEAIEDPRVAVAKVSDFTDNALSLHHTEKGMTSTSLRKKSAKYLLVCDTLIARLKRGQFEGNMPVSELGLRRMIKQLEEGREKLVAINLKHAA
jgi:(p)ppGpp synthase/HD superfamily hydrolase